MLGKRLAMVAACAVLHALSGAAAATPEGAPDSAACGFGGPLQRYSPRLAVALNAIDDNEKMPAISRSPDGRWAAWITHCGDLATNRNIYHLWVYDLAALETALRRHFPVPAPAYNIRREGWDNEAGISALQWSDDRRQLTFLSRAGHSMDRVEALELGSGKTATLVESTHRILARRQVPSGIVYARSIGSAGPPGEQPDENGFVPPGVFLSRYLKLWPERSESSSDAVEIWLSAPGAKPRKLAAIPEQVDFAFPSISFSPDGRYATAVLPNRTPGVAWRRYRAPFALLQGRLDDGTATRQYLFDLKAGTARPLIDAPAGSMLGYSLIYDTALWSSNGRSVILRSSGMPLSGAPASDLQERISRPYVVEVEIPSLHVRGVAPLPSPSRTSVDAAHAELPPLAIHVNRGGREVSFERRAKGGPIGPLIATKQPGGWRLAPASSRPADETGQRFSLKVSQDFDHPPSIVATDRNTKRTIDLQDVNPVLRSMDGGHVTVLEWKDARGRSWRGGLVHPPGPPAQKPLPLVIQFYGFSEKDFLADGPFRTAFAARSLAARNMLVLQAPQPAEYGVPDEGPSNLDMILAAIDKLVADGLVDRNRVGLVGFSSTCYPLKYAIANAPGAFRAAVAADGRDMGMFEYILNFSETPTIGAFDAYFYGMFGDSPYSDKGIEQWRRLSPIFKSSQIRAALLDQGSRKASVLYAWEMHAALRRNHIPSEVLDFPSGAHELDMPAERLLSMQSTVNWMAFWLQGEEDLPTLPSGTLERWIQMREEMQKYHGADHSNPPAPVAGASAEK